MSGIKMSCKYKKNVYVNWLYFLSAYTRFSRKCCQTTFFPYDTTIDHIPYHHHNRIEICFLNVDWRIDVCVQKSFYVFPCGKKISTARWTTYWMVNSTLLYWVIQFHTNHHGHRTPFVRKIPNFEFVGKLEACSAFKCHLNATGDNHWWTWVCVKLINFWPPLFAYNLFRIDISWNG